jgi:hypothetical protein
VSEVEKIRASLFGKTTDCEHCNDLNTFYKDSIDKLTIPLEHEYVDLDSDKGKEWQKTNNSDNIPVSKVCTVTKEGKEDCQTFLGVDEAKAFVNKYAKKS